MYRIPVTGTIIKKASQYWFKRNQSFRRYPTKGPKGQLISKGLFGILNSPEKRTKILDFTTIIKFIYSEKATKFCKISTLLLTGTTSQ